MKSQGKKRVGSYGDGFRSLMLTARADTVACTLHRDRRALERTENHF